MGGHTGRRSDSGNATRSVDPVVEEILHQEDGGDGFRISADRLRDLLGLGDVDFYRQTYSAALSGNPLVALSTMTGAFSRENIGELVSLLELLTDDEVERKFKRAGVFFPYSDQFEILSGFLVVARDEAHAHRIDTDAFSGMLRVYRSFEEARAAYFDAFFDIAALIARATAEYCNRHPFPRRDVAERNVARLLEFFFRRHVLDRETVLAAVSARLFDVAVEAGYAERPEEDSWYSADWGEESQSERRADGREDAHRRRERHRNDDRHGGAGRSEHGPARRGVAWARRIMGVRSTDLTRSVLKTRYKQLMKQYHPDINPHGLVRCQEVNAAYSILLDAMENGA